MLDEPPHERPGFLSTEVADRRGIRLAIAATVGSAVAFLAVAPLAKIPLAPVPAFIPAYESALITLGLITAILLFGQFRILRSRALLVLASGYLFTAVIAVSHALTFPGLFAPAGLLGAGPQSTAWLYLFWHGGFPLLVMAYALIDDGSSGASGTDAGTKRPREHARVAILSSIAAVLVLVCGLTLIATAGHEFLPAIMDGNRISTPGSFLLSGAWVLSLAALAALWWRRRHTVLDLWLMVVMCTWVFDIALSAILNSGRYDLGWYAGRIYGLLAASVLLAVLLIENGNHFARLVRISATLSNANDALVRLSLQDDLTNLANRRFFDTYLAAQVAIAHRHKRSLALVLCDVDAFKAYNDHYGHQAGDECLKQVAAALRSCCRRPGDIAARYGGEEFAMILPDTALIGAASIAETARDAIAQLGIPHAYSTTAPHVSISGGVAVLFRRVDSTAQQLIMEADLTLYKAKHLGRNRMVSAPAEPA